MKEILYTDKLIDVTEETLLFRHYYFPFGSKRINFDHIEQVTMLKPTLFNGKWRIHGTGDFRTWFARDLKRPVRDLLFIARLAGRWWRIGFTVEDSESVIRIFKEKKLINKAERD